MQNWSVMSILSWFPFKIIKIVGPSMDPTFHSGDFVLIRKISKNWDRIKQGDVLAFRQKTHKGKILMVKRVHEINQSTRTCYVLGDNPDQSIDSRNFGSISCESVLGIVIRRL